MGGLPVHRHHVAIVIAQGVPHPGTTERKRDAKTAVGPSASFPPLFASPQRGMSRRWCVLHRLFTHSLTHSQKPTCSASPYLQLHRAAMNSPQFNPSQHIEGMGSLVRRSPDSIPSQFRTTDNNMIITHEVKYHHVQTTLFFDLTGFMLIIVIILWVFRSLEQL